jgi:hypothetical protein
MRTRLAIALGLTSVLAAPSVLAQEPGIGRAGTFAISAERLMGYSWSKTKTEGEVDPGDIDVDTENSRTQFDFLARGTVENPFVAPRLAFDYFVIDGLSIGGAIAYYSTNEETETDIEGFADPFESETRSSGFLIAPRVGYLYMFSPMFGIWPRGGITYTSGSSEDENGDGPDDDDELEANAFDLTLEGMFVIAPVPHAGFTLGPTFDIPLAGSGEVTLGNGGPGGPQSGDLDKVRITSIGIQAGVLVWF